MSENYEAQFSDLQRPVKNNQEDWKAYWKAQGLPWRTEPEIDSERQRYLTERLAIKPDIEQGIYPFKDIKLNRADVEWLLMALVNMRQSVYTYDKSNDGFDGLDLRGADLREENLSYLPLTRLRGGLSRQEWFTADQQEHLDWANSAAVHLEAANLSYAHLEQAILFRAHLEAVNLFRAHLENAYLSESHLEGANLRQAHLDGESTNLREAHLEGAILWGTHLEQAYLAGTHLEGTNLREVHLEGSALIGAHLEGTVISATDIKRIGNSIEDFPQVLPPADLRGAFFDSATALKDIILGNSEHGYVLFADLTWGGANLALTDWDQVKMVGDEYEAEMGQDREEYEVQQLIHWGEYRPQEVKNKDEGTIDKATQIKMRQIAVRASRQLSFALQNQGINEKAAYFDYRARVLQRKVLWEQKKFWAWLFSKLLDTLAGYGYRMWHIFVSYVVIVAAFALAYFVTGILFGPSHFSLPEAFYASITAFHGRVFATEQFKPDTLQAWITALEAIAGLIIESVFVAMLVQRFFGK